MAVSCCAMRHVLKCKMKTMNLFIYLLRGHFRRSCHFWKVAWMHGIVCIVWLFVITNAKTHPKLGSHSNYNTGWFQLFLLSIQSKSLYFFVACFFFLIHGFVDGFGTLCCCPTKALVASYSMSDTHQQTTPSCILPVTARNVLLQQLYTCSGPCW